MAFKDSYTPPPFDSPEFVSPAEKAELAVSNEEFPITGVRVKPDLKYEGLQYFVDIVLDGEPRTITFSDGVFTRDDLFNKLIDYFKVDKEPVPVFLRKEGQAYLVEVVGLTVAS